jgi:diphosphomevalonate decarboxylase
LERALKKIDVIRLLLGKQIQNLPVAHPVQAFAPANIALCKYWGKRERELNLPQTSSLSISLGEKGATTQLAVIEAEADVVFLNDVPVPANTEFYRRLVAFLDLFRNKYYFKVTISSNLPIAAGLATSASGFAAVVLALNKLFQWQVPKETLSIFARLGSGSAARSITTGFVEWQAGRLSDGFDSYAVALPLRWETLCVGLLIFNQAAKKIGSRDAMQQTVATSPFYAAWPALVASDLEQLKIAIMDKNLSKMGFIAESNALAMHATMQAARPAIIYSEPATISAMQQIWQMREAGINVFFTQDAGPNLKLLFEESALLDVLQFFSKLEIVRPFSS